MDRWLLFTEFHKIDQGYTKFNWQNITLLGCGIIINHVSCSAHAFIVCVNVKQQLVVTVTGKRSNETPLIIVTDELIRRRSIDELQIPK